MVVKKLKGWKHGLKCEHCRRVKPAKYIVNGSKYCKRCYKRFRHLQHTLKLNRPIKKYTFRYKQKTVPERIKNLRRRATPAELCFKEKLEKCCPVKFKFQRGFIKGGYYAIVDFHIPSRNICIEIDGGYHNRPEQKRKDEYRDKWLREVRKQKVIRLTNQQAEEISTAGIKELVR
ncbi:hypothetical protein LCGC14_0972740 [marine sediment metagenome]|uniref:DUF559 domain-containing protein n=1 Tax=marine sediment metagenome TaxID=412755 RepID=A0A0F9NX90_9ZZZZ